MNKNSLQQQILTNLQINCHTTKDIDDPTEFEWTKPLKDVDKISWTTEEKMGRSN
jgi:hypothetical protein